jgi:hypothetical protein
MPACFDGRGPVPLAAPAWSTTFRALTFTARLLRSW